MQILDLGTFNNYNATTVSNMFSNCSNLRTIYVEGSDTKWKETKRIFNYNEYDESMFDNCNSLVGGTGVAFSDEKNSSVLMAKVNGGYFTAKLHSITVEECTDGILSSDKSQAAMNEVVTLTAIPDDEYKEAVITVLDSLGNPVEITDDSFVMPASDVTVSASFVPKKYTVQWKNGSEIVETDNVPYGTIPQFNGEAPSDYSDENNHYTFSGWNDGENTYAVNELPAVTSDVSYTAVYTEAEHSYGEPEWAWAQDYSSVAATFTCTVCGETETVNATVTSENSRDKITYTATAEFEGNTYTDIRVVNKTLSTVTVVPSENGTVTANLSEAYEGEEVMLTVNPNADSKLASLTVKDAENNEITVTDNKFTMPASNVTVTAVFEKLQLINMVEPYIDDEGAYILGTVEHYVDAIGTNYAVNNDGSVGSVLESTALSYFDFELMSDGTYRVNHFTGPTANMTELVIPKTFNGKKITVVGSNDQEIFYNSKKTQFDLVLNENITKIDQYTFYVLYVKEVKGDTSGLKTIGRYAFSWANSPGAYEISLDLNYDGTIQTDYCAFNNMKVTFNLKHSTKISFNTPNSQSISYNFTDAHVYGEPVWTWAEDYSSATATFTCTDSRCNHKDILAATVDFANADHKRVYTATVEFNSETYTDTQETDIPLDTDAYYAALDVAQALIDTGLTQYEEDRAEAFTAEIAAVQADFAAALTQEQLDALTARILTAVETLRKGYIEPEYKGSCTITCLGGVTVMTNGEAAYDAEYDEKVYLLAPNSETRFAYTNEDGSEIYAYLVSNILYAPHSNEIFVKAVSTVMQGKAFIAGTSFENRKAKYNCQYSIPDGATLVETGIVMSFDKATTLEIGTEETYKFIANKIGANNEYSISFNIGNSYIGKTIYGKCFVTYILNEDEITVYSEQHNIQLKEE